MSDQSEIRRRQDEARSERMTRVNLGWEAILKEPSEWPCLTCPECGVEVERRRPLGGHELCLTCLGKKTLAEREKSEAEERARETQRERDAETKALERAHRAEGLPALLAEIGCPPRYCGFTKASWEARYGPWEGPATSRLSGWTGESPETWLVLLYGLYGRRKTSLATALLGERLVDRKKCLWLDAVDWCRSMQAGFKDDTQNVIYERAERAEVLLLDDVGSILGGRTGRREEQRWWAEQIATLLRHREAWIMPTIVTANVEKLDELGQIDNSLVPRMDVPLAFRMPGKNYRGGHD